MTANLPTAGKRIGPQQMLRDIADRFSPGKVAISFSGAEDVALIDMAHRAGVRLPVFSLDTGRLHPETYTYLERVRSHYDLDLELLMPEPAAVGELVRRKGLFSFYQDGHGECCAVRKIEPLRRKLGTLDAWITGQRQDQSVTRSHVPIEERDKGLFHRRTAAGQVQPAGRLDFRRSLGVLAQTSGAGQRVAPSGLCFHRFANPARSR